MKRGAVLLVAAIGVGVAWAGDADDGWVQYADKDAVVSYSKALEGSKVLAMRGVSTVDVPIARLMGVYLDTKRSTDWVDLLVQLDEHPVAGTDDAIERQIYDMPWPVADREFVFKRTVTWEPERKTVTIRYTSIDDPRYPVTDTYVRATDYGSFWRFTAQPGGTTRVEAVAMVDPEGSLPAWLFNSVQKSWPRESIEGLLKEAAKTDVVPLAKVADW
ncbi:MAG: hypothetical protein H6733_07135 [Alphaproteobacteria bacterium]|nr:hypothetical protein [Alphaproteobacteria bacterium]